MPNVKISGITNKEDAKWAALLGVEYISVSLIKDSAKKVSIDRAAEILDMLPSYTRTILELGNSGNDISFKKARKLNPDFFSVNEEASIDIIADAGEQPERCRFILELPPDFAGSDRELDERIKFIQINADEKSREKLSEIEFNSEKDIIINGDFELRDIIRYCKKLSPHAWSIRNAVEKSPRRIDYKKMKEYIREISLI